MKNILLGVALIVLIGFAGFFYRNAVEHSQQPVACPLDAKLCPDGTSVARTGNACTFSACLPPNMTLESIAVSYALPAELAPITATDAGAVAAYTLASSTASSTMPNVLIRQFATTASSTALSTIQATAISGTSGMPVPATSFTSTVLGNHRFTVVTIERFEGVVMTAYYLARTNDVLRFDAVDRNVANWTSSSLDTTTLPAHSALRKLLTTLQAEQ